VFPSPVRPPFVTAIIVPTGIGASIGGFAGDATPVMNLAAHVSDVLITHPNVANAAVFQKLPENALYVEGYALDAFFRGEWGLQPVHGNRVGVLLDAGIPDDMRTLHLNTVRAVQAVYGVDIAGIEITGEPVQIDCIMTESGCSAGTLKNPDALLRTAGRLLEQGATAIAVLVLLPEFSDEQEELYRAGGGVDPIGGIEAVLSHWLVSRLGIPCAHAPVFPWEVARPVTDTLVDPRTAAEFIAPTFLPCVLTGLQRAPRFTPLSPPPSPPNGLTIDQLSALIVPGDALGGVPVLSALKRRIPVLAVAENQTILAMDAAVLPPSCRNGIISVRSYEEAVGRLVAIKLGHALR